MLMKEVRTHGVRSLGVTSDSKKQLFFLCAAGLVAGLINGLIGTGGGIIIVYALTYFMRIRRGAGLATEPGGDINIADNGCIGAVLQYQHRCRLHRFISY
jgi:hypothetical protein